MLKLQTLSLKAWGFWSGPRLDHCRQAEQAMQGELELPHLREMSLWGLQF